MPEKICMYCRHTFVQDSTTGRQVFCPTVIEGETIEITNPYKHCEHWLLDNRPHPLTPKEGRDE